MFDWEFVARPGTCLEKLPGAALFGNSFSDLYWSLGIQNYFCQIRRSRTFTRGIPSAARLADFINDMPPETKYFIFQFVVPYLPDEAPIFGPAESALLESFARPMNPNAPN